MLHFAAINNISKTIRSAVSQRVSKRKKKKGDEKGKEGCKVKTIGIYLLEDIFASMSDTEISSKEHAREYL